jgi:hypothetical protein
VDPGPTTLELESTGGLPLASDSMEALIGGPPNLALAGDDSGEGRPTKLALAGGEPSLLWGGDSLEARPTALAVPLQLLDELRGACASTLWGAAAAGVLLWVRLLGAFPRRRRLLLVTTPPALVTTPPGEPLSLRSTVRSGVTGAPAPARATAVPSAAAPKDSVFLGGARLRGAGAGASLSGSVRSGGSVVHSPARATAA